MTFEELKKRKITITKSITLPLEEILDDVITYMANIDIKYAEF